jgi:carbonic anhydrase
MKKPLLLALALSSTLAFASGGGGHEPPAGPAPEAVLGELKAGNRRFIDGKLTHPRQDAARRKELAGGQAPSAIVLSCSDSRVPPELVFDKGLGELFTVRVAGNVVGMDAMASIEYAVEHLGARLIVVMGHESCGAVKAALTTPAGKGAGSPDLDGLVATIQGNLGEGTDRAIASADDKKLRRPVMRNVDAVAARLLSRSKVLRKRHEEGKVRIVPAVYSLETGAVEFWGAGAPKEAD